MVKQSHFISAAVMTLAIAATSSAAQASLFSKIKHAVSHSVKVIERKTVNTVKDVGRIAGKDVKAVAHVASKGVSTIAHTAGSGANTIGKIAVSGAKTTVKVVRTTAAIPALAYGGALVTKGRIEQLVHYNSGDLAKGRKAFSLGEKIMGGSMVGHDPIPVSSTGKSQAALKVQQPMIARPIVSASTKR